MQEEMTGENQRGAQKSDMSTVITLGLCLLSDLLLRSSVGTLREKAKETIFINFLYVLRCGW